MQISLAFSRLSASLLIAFAALLLLCSQPALAAQQGIPWGTNNDLARRLVGSNSNFGWYHNWGQSSPVGPLSSAGLHWVPTLWGPSKLGSWHGAEQWFRSRGKRPKYILAQNEPDVPSQSNQSPRAAAKLWMQELHPWQRRGAKVGSAQLCWDITNWMEPFLKALRSMGGKPDFCVAHYYGPANDMKRFRNYVRNLRSTCGKYGIRQIWLTEIGIMASSHPSQGEVNNFASEALRWLNTQSYVKRAAWIGAFKIDEPYDGFMSQKNAFFNSDGSLRALGRMLSHGNFYRREMHRQHTRIADALSEANATLADSLARLDDPRGQTDASVAKQDDDDSDEHPDDDDFWAAKFAQEDAKGQGDHAAKEEEDDDDDDLSKHNGEDDDDFADGFLADLVADEQ